MPARYLQTKFPSLPKHRHKRLILRRWNNCSVDVHALVITAALKASDSGEDGQ
jgi:hypothetical protein